MPEAPNTMILDRSEAQDVARRHFAEQIDLVEQIVNYCTQLVIRAFRSSDRQLADMVVIVTLFKQAVAMLDGIHVLLAQGAVNAALLQVRGLYEASVQIRWILREDTDGRARAY